MIRGGISSKNGSGKSVLKSYLPTELLGVYLNPDEIETVMSHPGKVALLAEAQRAGYRTHLYYLATDDPDINVSRVRNRVGLGGHPVPEDKIVSRYHRSLDLLMEAIKQTNRAYIFDNLTDNADRKLAWVAEITEGRALELRTNQIPPWFKRAVVDRL